MNSFLPNGPWFLPPATVSPDAVVRQRPVVQQRPVVRLAPDRPSRFPRLIRVLGLIRGTGMQPRGAARAHRREYVATLIDRRC